MTKGTGVVVGIALLAVTAVTIGCSDAPDRMTDAEAQAFMDMGPASEADFAFSEMAPGIEWEDPAVVEQFVESLKAKDEGAKFGYQTVYHEGMATSASEVRENNFYPENFMLAAPNIQHFKQQLDSYDIDLLFLPIAEGTMVYPDFYWDQMPLADNGLPRQVTLSNKRFFAELERLGVAYVNLAPAFILARKYSKFGHARSFLREHGRSSHWSRSGAALSAHIVANEIKQNPDEYPWYAELEKLEGLEAHWYRDLESEEMPAPITPDDVKKETDPRALRYRRVITGLPDPRQEPDVYYNSPIVVIGDSNMKRWFGFPDQISYELKVPVEVYGGDAFSPENLIAVARRDPDWWLAKKLVIWSVANRKLGRPQKWAVAIHPHTIFPDGIEAARERAAILDGGSERLEVTGTVSAVSTARSVEEWAPYTSALIYLQFRVNQISGTGAVPGGADEVVAVGWGMVDKQHTWLTRCEPGERYHLELEALELHPELAEFGSDMDAVEDLSAPPYVIVGIRSDDREVTLPKGPAGSAGGE